MIRAFGIMKKVLLFLFVLTFVLFVLFCSLALLLSQLFAFFLPLLRFHSFPYFL